MGAFPEQDFSSLLDELLARTRQDASPSTGGPSISVDILGVMASAQGETGAHFPHAAFEYRQSAEREMMEAEAVSILDHIVVTAPPSIEPEAIALELGLSASFATSGRVLDRARRDFAFANHPDRVDAAMRDRAMVRMQIANQLIDAAKRKSRA